MGSRPAPARRIGWGVSRGVLLAALAAASFVLVVTWAEPRMLFYPERRIEATPERLGMPFTDVRLTASDGTRLHGWLLPATGAGAAPPRLTVLFFHGNAGNISHRLDKLAILADLGVDVLILDYRGYGASEGRPDERGIQRDARAGYEHLVGELGRRPETIVLYGESMGGAVAAHLASEVKVGGVVLESAFTSATDMAQSLFPFLPVGWAMRNRFDTRRAIHGVRAPVLILHSRDDEVVPYRHGERLAAAAPDAFLVELRGGHNDAFLVSGAAYRRALASYLAGVTPRAAAPPRP